MSVKRYKINLDLSPEKRWEEVINDNQEALLQALESCDEMIGNSWFVNSLFWALNKLGLVLYCREIEGIANQIGVSAGKIASLQLMYEASTACTSIVTQGKDGVPVHIRTMDWEMEFLTPLTVEVDFYQNDEKVFTGTTWPGYVGILTGMKPNGYTVSINYRRSKETLLTNALNALTSAWPIGFLVRHSLTKYSTYSAALEIFRNSRLIAPVYIIISGTQESEGAIVTRDRSEEVPFSLKFLENNAYLVQTNIDHWRGDSRDSDWQDIEWSRRRRRFAKSWLNSKLIDGEELTLENLWELMETEPIKAFDTIYTTAMCCQTEEYETRKRE